MSYEGSLLHLKNWSSEKFYSLFHSVDSETSAQSSFKVEKKTALLVFLEASTRTRFSFEIACHNVGCKVSTFSADSATSLSKGETHLDTLENLEAMKPDLIVLRAPSDFDFLEWESNASCPVINAGWGSFGHPTQALLDLYTLHEKFKDLSGLRVLIVGDVKHSRVARSHFEAAKILGLKIGLCGPKELLPSDVSNDVKIFESLKEGMAWAQVYMALRIQKERHEPGKSLNASVSQFFLNEEKQKNWGEHLWVMHPGPVNYGVEIDRAVARSAKSLILKQVENGVQVRSAILRELLSRKGLS